MALIKTEKEIDSMRRGGQILSDALRVAVELVAPGVKLSELNEVAEDYMRSRGAEPSFLGYKSTKHDPPFPSAVCISINDEIVHGCGNRSIKLQEGDIVGLDIGCWYPASNLCAKGTPASGGQSPISNPRMCTDMAVTVGVGNVSEEARRLMNVTKEACLRAVFGIRVGGTVADVGRAVEDLVKPYGYGIVRSLVGHGVGHEVHEDPRIPNYYEPKSEKISFVENMCVAIEPMLALGDYLVITKDDGWAVAMKDGSLGAHFEVTIAIHAEGPEILTPLPV